MQASEVSGTLPLSRRRQAEEEPRETQPPDWWCPPTPAALWGFWKIVNIYTCVSHKYMLVSSFHPTFISYLIFSYIHIYIYVTQKHIHLHHSYLIFSYLFKATSGTKESYCLRKIIWSLLMVNVFLSIMSLHILRGLFIVCNVYLWPSKKCQS